MKKPLIGVTPLYDYNLSSWWIIPGYLEGIQKTGGLPVMLPFTDSAEDAWDLMADLDGLIITGGPDVNPQIYGEEPILQIGLLAPKRDVNEKLYFDAAIAMDKPILGICRGHQFINAMFGGTLYQDLPTQHPLPTNHSQKEPNYIASHRVDVLPDTPLSACMKGAEKIRVNSFHHQAIKTLGEGLAPMAIAEGEDLVESFYAPEYRFIWGTQWHPELLHKSPEEELKTQQLSIFKALVEASAVL